MVKVETLFTETTDVCLVLQVQYNSDFQWSDRRKYEVTDTGETRVKDHLAVFKEGFSTWEARVIKRTSSLREEVIA